MLALCAMMKRCAALRVDRIHLMLHASEKEAQQRDMARACSNVDRGAAAQDVANVRDTHACGESLP